MGSTGRWKVLALIVLLILAAWYLWPSVKYYRMSAEERAATDRKELSALESKVLHLGLDLKGGMHLVIEVDRSKLSADEAKDAVDRAIEIIRNRVDQFGVAEPVIQKQGEDRIVVQLPGLLDAQRAKTLIGQTAQLEFRLVSTMEETQRFLKKVDEILARKHLAEPEGGAEGGVDSLLAARPISARAITQFRGGMFFASDDIPIVQEFLEEARADSGYPGKDGVLLWHAQDDNMRGLTGKVLFLLEPKVELTGAGVKNAVKRIGLDPDQPNMPGVSLRLTSRGATRFARVTGANVGRQLAIILDGKVWSAPNIREKIRGGQASITGSFTDEEARDLAIVLRAGALPADVKIIEERTVGPSLGKDSIRMGIRAGIVGSILVVFFMIVYYRASGLVAVLALVLNVVFIFAVLAGFGATLTLPGIAGIVLTVGMAVDANVLIFERIREELRNRKTVRASIDSGYGRAFRTILDANVTTLISAVVLYQFGTGPIKGFAVTLSIGILANMFTAVVVTRMVFDAITSRKRLNTLSI